MRQALIIIVCLLLAVGPGLADQHLIPGVPNYDQELFPIEDPPSERGDCVPVACAMIHGYYDTNGWPRLVPAGSNDVATNAFGIDEVVKKYKVELGYVPGEGVHIPRDWWDALFENKIGDAIVTVTRFFDPGASFVREDDQFVWFSRMRSYLNNNWPCCLLAWPEGTVDSYKWEGTSDLTELPGGHGVTAVGWSDDDGHWIICNMGWSLAIRAWFNFDGDDDWYVSQITPGGTPHADDYLWITAPNGGEVWDEGTAQTITWDTWGSPGPEVRIEISADGGETWFTLADSTPNDGSALWLVPNVVADLANCKLRIASTSKPYCTDDSDGTFTIRCVPPSPPGAEPVSNVFTTSMTANWNAGSPPNPPGTQYWVECWTPALGGVKVGDSGWLEALACTFVGMTPNTRYAFRVVARDADGVESTWTELGGGGVHTLAEEPGPLSVETQVMAGGRLNPNAPGCCSLCILGIDPNGNPGSTEIAIRTNPATGAGWLRLIGGIARADGMEADWHALSAWAGVRLCGLLPGTAYTFSAQARNGDEQETALIQVGSERTNDACDVDRSGAVNALDYALIKAAILRGILAWPCDVNDDGALDASDLRATQERCHDPPGP